MIIVINNKDYTGKLVTTLSKVHWFSSKCDCVSTYEVRYSSYSAQKFTIMTINGEKRCDKANTLMSPRFRLAYINEIQEA